VSRFEELHEVVRAQMEEHSVPGVSLGVLFEGGEETAAFGVTSIEHPLDVSVDTLFQIGSITKTFTATALMRLVERGDVDLDARVRTYLAELRLSEEDVASRATVRQLLTHTGGWLGDFFADFGRGDDALARYVEALAEQPQLAPLGEVWSYNNSAFNIAGRVVEVVAGKPYEDALRELVFEPLGIESAYFFADEVITYRFAVGHERAEDERSVVGRPWAIGRSSHPAGGIVTSVPELLRYARFWIEGGDLLRPESVEEMTREQAAIGGNLDAVGLAWMLRTIDGVKIISHGGGTKGQSTALVIAPERRFALAVFTNDTYGGVLNDRVLKKAYDVYLGVREPELEAVDVDAEPYLGRYEARMADVEISRADDALQLRFLPKGGFPTPDSPAPPAPPPALVRFASENELFAVDDLWKGERIVILRDSGGRIEWLRVGGRVFAPVDS